MSAVPDTHSHRTPKQPTPPASASRTLAAINGAPPLPPKHAAPAERPPDMTMNGNAPPPEERAIASGPRTTTGGTAVRSSSRDATAALRHRGHPQTCDATSAAHRSLGLSGGSPADHDAAYCTEIARRSVARAALHLGMEAMEGEALDALGSVLLGYMAAVGTTISSNVEASGRSSAHANAYDALNALEVCTAPAATQLGSSAPTFAADTDAASRDQNRLKEAAQGQGWEGLACFLFGPDWFSIPLAGEGEEAAKEAASGANASTVPSLEKAGNISIQSNGKANAAAAPPKKAPGGKTLLPKRPPNSAANPTMPPAPKSGKGKQLINMKGNERSVSFSLSDRKQSNSGGEDPAVPGDDDSSLHNAGSAGRWHAPYLNAVPSFPVVTNAEGVANPHRLPGGVALSLSLHDLATEAEACRDPPPSPAAGKRPRRGSATRDEQRAALAARVARRKEEAADRAMLAALRIPDDVYSTRDTIWGSIQDTKTTPPNDGKKAAGAIPDGAKEKSAADSEPPKTGGGDKAGGAAAAKVKFDPATKQPPPSPQAGAPEPPALRPSYVPNFLPLFPADCSSDAARRDRRSVTAAASAAMGAALSRAHHREKRKPSAAREEGPPRAAAPSAENRDAVRRAVIGLGKSAGPSYWGSAWLDDDGDGPDGGAKRPKPNLSAEAAVVPASAAKKSGANNSSHVVPLGRASGSRLSKILEGSMNVS